MFNIHLKKAVFFLISILFFLCSLIILNAPSDASEGFYSIQTGTYGYNQKALDFAKKQFEMLSGKLSENEREGLRIEEGSKYYIVRLGRFGSMVEADKALENVKAMASDAFILKVTDFESVKILKSYDDKNQKRIESSASAKISPESDQGAKGLIVPKSKNNKKEAAADKKEAVIEPSPENLQANGNTENPLNKLIEDVSVRFDNKDYKKASELLKKGLEKWPDDPNLHAWYGATLLDSGSPETAYEEYRKAAELMPDVPDFHAGMGHSLLDSYIDRAKNSVTAFRKALEIDPDNVSALEGLGIVYVGMGKKFLATEIYEHLKGIDKNAAARLNEFIMWGIEWGEVK
jgi:tetratricopeptide (TPR) repeat protein